MPGANRRQERARRPIVRGGLAPRSASGYRGSNTCIYMDHDNIDVYSPNVAAIAQHGQDNGDA